MKNSKKKLSLEQFEAKMIVSKQSLKFISGGSPGVKEIMVQEGPRPKGF